MWADTLKSATTKKKFLNVFQVCDRGEGFLRFFFVKLKMKRNYKKYFFTLYRSKTGLPIFGKYKIALNKISFQILILINL